MTWRETVLLLASKFCLRNDLLHVVDIVCCVALLEHVSRRSEPGDEPPAAVECTPQSTQY